MLDDSRGDLRLNSSGVIPAPIFFCSGIRRLAASTTRTARTESTRCETAESVSTSLSITNPGLTPAPTRATPSSFAASSSWGASSGYFRNG